MTYRTFTDCDGNPVDLTFNAWEHILDHPEMEGCEEMIGLTIADPELRTQSPSPDRRCFYRRCNHPIAPDDYVKVVVAYRPYLDFTRDHIVTAFLAGSVSGEETEL